MRLSQQAWVLAVMAVGMSLITLGGIISARSLSRLDESFEWVAHTLEVLARSREVSRAVAEAAASSRGFRLTGEQAEYERLRAATSRLTEHLGHVRSMVAGDPDQAARWRQIEALVTERAALAEELVASSKAEPAAAPARTALDARALALSGQIEAQMAEFDRTEQALLAARRAEQRAALGRTFAASAGVAAAGVFIVGLAGWMSARETGRRTRVARDLEVALASLRAATEERDRFFSLSLDMLCIADAQRFRFVSPAIVRVLGWTPEEFTARPFLDLVHPDDRAATLREVDRQLQAGEPVLRFENRYRHKNGTWRVLSWTSMPQPDGLMYGIARDVTDEHEAAAALRTATAAAEEANRAKDRFLASMSHELRTPLNAIIGFGEMLEDGLAGELSDRQRRYVSNIVESGRHLLQLINDVLDLAKIESGRLQLQVEEFSPVRSIEEAIDIVRPLAAKKNISLAGHWPPDLPLLSADRSKFKQVLYNLLSNAVKFTRDGGAVRVSAALAEDGRLRVAVSDTGIGIKPADHERVWKEFEQVDSTYARAQQGTGLGLGLTRRLVELHGGRIRLESEGVEGGGTTFVLELPMRPQPPSAAAATLASQPGAEVARLTPCRPLVLVVEDDPKASMLLEQYLRSGGYDVAGARTAAEALELTRTLKPFAVTLDILLPDRPGWELLRDLREEPDTRDVPVVVVSITDDKQLGHSLGIVDFLVKPVARTQLLASIDRIRISRRRVVRSVLIIDDEPGSVEPVAEVLRSEGCTVWEARSGAEGVALALARRPDVVILDLLMPGMNGFEVVERLRSSAAGADVPILIYTAKDLTAEQRAALRGSVQGIAAKSAKEQLLADLACLGPVGLS